MPRSSPLISASAGSPSCPVCIAPSAISNPSTNGNFTAISSNSSFVISRTFSAEELMLSSETPLSPPPEGSNKKIAASAETAHAALTATFAPPFALLPLSENPARSARLSFLHSSKLQTFPPSLLASSSILFFIFFSNLPITRPRLITPCCFYLSPIRRFRKTKSITNAKIF